MATKEKSGFLRFAPDLLYEIKDSGTENTLLLRNGVPLGGGGGSGDSPFVEVHITITDYSNHYYEADVSYNDVMDIVSSGKIPYALVTYEEEEDQFKCVYPAFLDHIDEYFNEGESVTVLSVEFSTCGSGIQFGFYPSTKTELLENTGN